MIFTVGHSNHAVEKFLQLLEGAGITALSDVRSAPVSRWSPQFNKEALAKSLADDGIAYVYLGRELGGRPKDPALLSNGKPNYAAMAHSEAFQNGIARVLEGSKTYRVAMMCAERDPLDCHRFLLIARHLAERNIAVSPVLADGTLEPQQDTEARWRARNPAPDLFQV